MITKREAKERGHLNFGWLDAHHSFSFGSYFDPRWSGFRHLRVINEDWIDPQMGFDTHPHKDMEIITFILEGELEHRDTLGNHTIIKPGEIQVMSAGSGVLHSEFNSSKTMKTHALQIWIMPNEKNIKPRYDQISYLRKTNDFVTLAQEFPEESKIVKLYQDAKIELASFDQGFKTQKKIIEEKYYWIQITKGSGLINSIEFKSGDGLAISKEKYISIESHSEAEFLLFEMC